MEGSIIVDGVLASCYAFYDHDLAQIGMAPIQWYPRIIKWIFGEDSWNPVYVNIADNLGSWVLPYEA